MDSNESDINGTTGGGTEAAPDMNMLKGVMTIVYIFVFFIGTPGNLWIIYKLVRARLWSSSAAHLTVSQRSRIYICSLACSDLLLLLTLPFTASYNYNGAWIFGEMMCFTILTIEIVTKIFSIVLLTVMSLERYFIVCTRLRNSFQSWMSCVPLALGTFFCVVAPSALHFVHITHHRFEVPGMEHITVCILNMDELTFNIYASYTFIVGFVIPFIIMAFCYIMLVRHVKQKFKNRKVAVQMHKSIKEPRYMAEMRKSIWRIAVFHFICWAPFWAFTMVPHYMQLFRADNDQDMNERPPNWYVYCRLFANCLPYINAAGNWVLYAVLNSDVRKHIYHQPRKGNKFGFQSLSTV